MEKEPENLFSLKKNSGRGVFSPTDSSASKSSSNFIIAPGSKREGNISYQQPEKAKAQDGYSYLGFSHKKSSPQLNKSHSNFDTNNKYVMRMKGSSKDLNKERSKRVKDFTVDFELQDLSDRDLTNHKHQDGLRRAKSTKRFGRGVKPFGESKTNLYTSNGFIMKEKPQIRNELKI